MTNIPVPDPVAHAVTNKRHPKASIALHHDASFAEGDDDLLIEDLITITQAEAYATARVREALEEVNQVLEGLYTEALNARVPVGEDDEAWNITCLARAQSVSQAQLKIRALMPQQ